MTTTNVSRFVALATCTMLAACAAHDMNDGEDSPSSVDAGSKTDGSVILPPGANKDAGTSSDSKDSGGVTSTGLPAAPPRQADLAVWLDPATSIKLATGTTTVTSWLDITGQATVTPGGSVILNPIVFYGGHPGVVSNSSAVTISLKKNLEQRPFSVFVVERNLVSGTQGWIFGTNDATAYGYMTHLGLELLTGDQTRMSWTGLNGGASAAVIPLYMEAHIVSLHRHGLGVDVQIDEGAPQLDTTGSVVYDAAGVSGKAEQIFFGGVTGSVALGDILVYDAELSATDINNVNAYLKGRYSL